VIISRRTRRERLSMACLIKNCLSSFFMPTSYQNRTIDLLSNVS
jgi:hypothetical protein